MAEVINKFAFLVHEPSLYDHWKDIWRALDPDEFVILLMNKFRTSKEGVFARNVEKFLGLVESHGYACVFVDDLLKRGNRYRYVISNHVVAGSTMTSLVSAKKKLRNVAKRLVNIPRRLVGMRPFGLHGSDQYVSLRCGEFPVRIMYGADISDGWSLDSWNEQYPYFFCHGPNDEKAVRSRFAGEVYQMGYPRYDQYFNNPIANQNNPLFDEFLLSRDRQTVVWLPTLGKGVCSIPYYANHFAGLMHDFNVVVRPHPISFREEPENIQLLESLNFRIDRDDVRDMNQLYALADVVACDYGGTSFSALYLDKNIIQLNVPGAETWYTSANSSNMELRKLLHPVINPEEGGSLASILRDGSVWSRQVSQRETAFKKYFAPFRGSSSNRVVEVLRQLSSGKTQGAESVAN